MEQQLETQGQVIERLKDKIDSKDNSYMNALASPIFAVQPEPTNAEVVEVADNIIYYSIKQQ